MLRWFEHRQVYAPSREVAAKIGDLRRPAEEVFFHTADGVKLHGWFVPAAPASPRAQLVLLLLHGNAGNITHRLKFYQGWLSLGLNVFAFDYRGFGRSEGRPSEEGTYGDAQAAVHWLGQRGFQPAQIIALGKSLGGGVASELALREPLGALILQNTFTSIPDLGGELFPFLPVRRLHRIHYDTVNKLPRLHLPLLVAHSREDDLIGFHHGERNFAAANAPKQFLELRGSHNGTLEDDRDRYLAGIDHFLRQHLDPPFRDAAPGHV